MKSCPHLLNLSASKARYLKKNTQLSPTTKKLPIPIVIWVSKEKKYKKNPILLPKENCYFLVQHNTNRINNKNRTTPFQLS